MMALSWIGHVSPLFFLHSIVAFDPRATETGKACNYAPGLARRRGCVTTT